MTRLDLDLPGRAETSGIKRVNFDIQRIFLQPMPLLTRALSELMAQTRFDAILADSGFFGILPFLLGDPAARPPVLSYSTMPLMLSSRDTAPCGLGLAPSSTTLGRLRNRALTTLAQKVLLRESQNMANHLLDRMNSRQLPTFILDSGVLADRYIAPTVPEFDYPRSDLPANVRYVGAVFNDMPAGGWNGLLVEVKGTACAASPVCGTLTASKVEPGGLQVANAAAAEIEGFVTAISAGGFTLGAQPVVVTASTRFENGVAGDLIVGAKLEAEGSISGGILTATKVSFRDNVRLEGDIASIVGNALTLAGLPGLTVDVTSLTELDGVTSVAALGVGNHLRIRGRAGAANRVTATELERRSTSPDSRVELRGPVASISNPTLTILGVVIDSSTVAESEFKDRADAPIGRAAFFAALRVGDLVKGRGDLVGGAVRWSELELED